MRKYICVVGTTTTGLDSILLIIYECRVNWNQKMRYISEAKVCVWHCCISKILFQWFDCCTVVDSSKVSKSRALKRRVWRASSHQKWSFWPTWHYFILQRRNNPQVSVLNINLILQTHKENSDSRILLYMHVYKLVTEFYGYILFTFFEKSKLIVSPCIKK